MVRHVSMTAGKDKARSYGHVVPTRSSSHHGSGPENI